MFIIIVLVLNPGQFIFTILLCLTPLFLLSGYLAFRLAKDIERNEKTKRVKSQHASNITKVRKRTKQE
jgi:hypothetical protein